jgi:hypothetical protein
MVEFALVIPAFDYIIMDPTNRKFNTYRELGWDEKAISNFLNSKQNHEVIASFTTKMVSFTASSRRNRFYTIYNRNDMLDHEMAYPNVIQSLILLSKHFQIFIITNRTKDLEVKTLSVMRTLGFPLYLLKIYFKDIHESFHVYKWNCMKEISQEFPSGAAIITHPSDGNLITSFGYTPIGFCSIKESFDFEGSTEIICENWNQVVHSLGEQ